MSIPDYQIIMLPLLDYIKDQAEHSLAESIEALVKKLKLTDPACGTNQDRSLGGIKIR